MVSDSDGPVGPAVTVMATRRNQGRYSITRTDENGRFSLVGLPPGEYLVIAMDMGARDPLAGARGRVTFFSVP